MNLSEHRIVVTGGANGIGFATAKVTASLGAEVVIWDIAGSDEAARRLRDEGLKVTGQDCDVTDRKQVERLAAALGHVNAVVASAGICPFMDWTSEAFDEVFDRTIDVNVKGVLNAVRPFFQGMADAGGGRIVLLGSVSGRTASVSDVHYATSKGGVHSIVRWLASRGAPHGILVNGVAPGPIMTSMVSGRETELAARIPLKRLGKPEEIAWPIAFLCSPRASFMTGAIVDVNGGVFIG